MEDLEKLRERIDGIDDEIIKLLIKREDIVKEVADFKKINNIDILDEKREQEIIKKIKEKCSQQGIDEQYLISIYHAILKISKQEQEKLIK